MKMEEYLKNIEDNNVSYWLYVRENLKPNDYVKLNTGEITRSMNISPIKGNKVYYANGDDYWFDISAVRNFSSNIIELLEENDLLKIEYFSLRYKERVTRLFEVTYKDNKNINLDNEKCSFMLTNNEFNDEDKKLKPIIKSIVTHEQFSQMEYKVGE